MDEKNIELRSEKVRNIVGQIPSVLLRYGITIIGLSLLTLIIISAFIPYKKTIPIFVTIHSVPQTVIIKSPATGTILIDSSFSAICSGQVLGYIRCQNKIKTIKATTNGILFSNVSNNNEIKENDILFAIVPDCNTQNLYAETALDDVSKIQIHNKVVVYDNDKRMVGYISQIYPIQSKEGKNKVRIDFKSVTFSHQTPNNQFKAEVIIAESTILKYFFGSLGIHL